MVACTQLLLLACLLTCNMQLARAMCEGFCTIVLHWCWCCWTHSQVQHFLHLLQLGSSLFFHVFCIMWLVEVRLELIKVYCDTTCTCTCTSRVLIIPCSLNVTIAKSVSELDRYIFILPGAMKCAATSLWNCRTV